MNQVAGADRTSLLTNGPQALRYKVKGMDCPTCAGKIETAVSRLPGVAKASRPRISAAPSWRRIASGSAGSSPRTRAQPCLQVSNPAKRILCVTLQE